MTFPFVSIVVPAFNEEVYIEKCLQSLFDLSYPRDSFEVIVVDNGSTDRTREIAESYPVMLLEKPFVNVGAVRNYGVNNARGDLIAFLDADCVVDSEWLNKGVDLLRRQKKCVFGGQYLIREEASWLERYWVLNTDSDKVHQTTLVGGNIFVHKEDFNFVGGFDEKMSAGEDSELTERMRSLGYQVEIAPCLSVVHLGYPSTVGSFLKRQIWHSSGYVDGIPGSFRDKIFLITIVFIMSVSSFMLFLIFDVEFMGWLSLLVIFLPMLLSFKRIFRSGKKYFRIRDLSAIYVVDFLYLIGRSVGVIKSIIKSKRIGFVQD